MFCERPPAIGARPTSAPPSDRLVGETYATPPTQARPAHPSRLEPLAGLQLLQPPADRVLRDPGRARHHLHPVRPMRLRLRRHPQPSSALITLRPEQPPALGNLSLRYAIEHPRQSVRLRHANSFSAAAQGLHIIALTAAVVDLRPLHTRCGAGMEFAGDEVDHRNVVAVGAIAAGSALGGLDE
jgi:hypothetical protein